MSVNVTVNSITSVPKTSALYGVTCIFIIPGVVLSSVTTMAENGNVVSVLVPLAVYETSPQYLSVV